MNAQVQRLRQRRVEQVGQLREHVAQHQPVAGVRPDGHRDRAGVDSHPSRSRWTGATNRSRIGVVEARALLSGPPADGRVERQGGRVHQADDAVEHVVQGGVDALEVDQVGHHRQQVAQQLPVPGLDRDGDGDRAGLNLQAEQVDVERVELQRQQDLACRHGSLEEVSERPGRLVARVPTAAPLPRQRRRRGSRRQRRSACWLAARSAR